MKICVVGAGGVGGLLAAVLRRAGVDVSLLVTERHLTAIRRNGLALIAPSGRFSVEIQAELDRPSRSGRAHGDAHLFHSA